MRTRQPDRPAADTPQPSQKQPGPVASRQVPSGNLNATPVALALEVMSPVVTFEMTFIADAQSNGAGRIDDDGGCLRRARGGQENGRERCQLHSGVVKWNYPSRYCGRHASIIRAKLN